MKKLALFILTLCITAGIYVGVQYAHNASYKPIVVVIPSFNNKDWYAVNLASILNQDYPRFRVIYIDDNSPDGTGDLVEQYLAQHDTQHRVTLIKNSTRKLALANLYDAIHSCDDQVIIATVDGDDWLKDEHVLSKLNDAYKDANVWLTYGQYEMDPPEYPGICREFPQWVIDQNAYRNVQWVTSHLRTFYAGLFKKIKKEDLMYQGEFFPVTWDMAFMLPMLEMAGGRFKFIPDVLYVYNCNNQLNDFKNRLQEQLYLNQYIRNKKKYTKLASL